MKQKHRKILIPTIAFFIFILILGNVKGTYTRFFFNHIGVNVNIIFSEEINKPIYDQLEGVKGIELKNSEKVFYDSLDGYNSYIHQNGTELCRISINNKASFFGEKDNIYIVERFFDEGYGEYSNSLKHIGDALLFYNLSSEDIIELYRAEKGVWCIFAYEMNVVLFDSNEKNLIIINMLTGEELYREDLSVQINNYVCFTIFEDYFNMQSNSWVKQYNIAKNTGTQGTVSVNTKP